MVNNLCTTPEDQKPGDSCIDHLQSWNGERKICINFVYKSNKETEMEMAQTRKTNVKRNLSVAFHVASNKSESHHIKIDLGVGDSHQNIFFQVE